MSYLGVHVDHARALAESLRVGADLADHAQALIGTAAGLADLPMPGVLVLDGVVADLELMARQIERAVAIVTNYQLALHGLAWWSVIPEPVRTPVPEPTHDALAPPTTGVGYQLPVQWDAQADSAWNEVHQDASHNSYAVVGGVDVLFDHGVRAFELDIHRQPPAHVLHSPTDDPASWHIYHVLGWSHRAYRLLPQGLAAIAALESKEPVTVFVDNKNDFGGAHTADEFDRVLQQEFGDRLFTPQDLIARSPAAASLIDAVHRDGWPTVHELEGRILVVLTDNIDGYEGADRHAFVAPPPSFVIVDDQVVHEPDASVVFYNADARQITAGQVAAMQRTNTVLRTYFNSPCPEHFIDEEPIQVNYRAVDTAIDGSTCETRVLIAPTPVPEPG